MNETAAKINDRVVAALFAEVPSHEAYAAIPSVVQTLYGLSEHSIDTPAETLLRLLSGLGLDTREKVADFLSIDRPNLPEVLRLLDTIEDHTGDSQGFGSHDSFAVENAVDSIRDELTPA